MNIAHDSRVHDASAPVISARNLRKAYKNKLALDGTSFAIEPGHIVGLIGPNGAGKTTALKAIIGLIPFEGELTVLGRDPRTERDALMNDVCLIADV
ncbi:MAG: ATP-binding cassette domain-containing protein, partial [Luteimonas sp.]